jgi:hypothetical protein
MNIETGIVDFEDLSGFVEKVTSLFPVAGDNF